MIIHIVQQGETIDTIAEKYGLSAERIILDNEITNPNNLVDGQTIVIVYPKQMHKVKEGDTLESIASLYGVSQLQLLRNNPSLSESDVLYIGETIVIDYDEEKIGDISLNGFTYPFINQKYLRKLLPFLTFLTIYSYGFTPDGEILQINDQEVINLAKEYGVIPVMMLSTVLTTGINDKDLSHAVLNNEEAQVKLIQNIIHNMLEKGYITILVNFGFIKKEDSDAYVSFINKLTDSLHNAGLRIAIALDPAINTKESVIYEGYNFAELGKKVNTVLLETYQWGYYLGPTLPIAPITLMREMFDYSVKVIPPEKTYIGIPTIGYDWTLPYTEKDVPYTMSCVSALNLALEVGANILYDEVNQAPFFTYRNTYNKKVTEHIVWFEDARSIDAKIKLIPEYGFRGASILNVMYYFAQLWLMVNVQYNIRKTV